jgi:hypothetical protein
MSKIQRGWVLVLRSLAVLRQNPKLLVFPGFILAITVLVLLFILVLLFQWDTGFSPWSSAHWSAVRDYWMSFDKETGKLLHVNPLCYLVLPVINLILMFGVNFCNVAFFNEIFNALNGQPVSVRGGLRFAGSRIGAIVVWSLFTGVVGYLIQSLGQYLGGVGRWICKLIGLTWQLASLFVLPVLVRETNSVNPLGFLRSAALLLTRTWGESLVGYAGTQVIGRVVVAISLPLLVLSVVASLLYNGAVLMTIVLIFLVWFLLIGGVFYILHVLERIFLGALFIFATEGVVPGPFDKEMMDAVWKVKNGRPAAS